ncbi:hypothetical protein [Streptomyces niveus]|uniref:hypothetical protein n=1 Tax=Streptomyces niveus TaxID=193462 RepID=UPI00368700A3
MRPTYATAVSALLLAALTACGGSDEGDANDKPKDAPPPYTVVKEKGRSVDLLVEEATKDSATAAIHDWIDKSIGDRKYASVAVVRSKDAGTIVCRAEYVADEQTAEVQTGGRITASDWPHTELDCPDPGGS